MRAGIYWARESYVFQFRHRRVRRLARKVALRHPRRQAPDERLRDRLTPGYEIGCSGSCRPTSGSPP